jgi:hypothetical protein
MFSSIYVKNNIGIFFIFVVHNNIACTRILKDMYNNARKRKLVSKRHGRRIIANETNIDIAGLSRYTLQWHTASTSFKQCTCSNLQLRKVTDRTVNYKKCMNNDKNGDKINNIHVQIIPSGNHSNFDNSNETDNDNSDNCIIKEGKKIDDNNDNKLKNALRSWVISHNITHNACNALLKIFGQHTSYTLPTDVRALLETPRQTHILKTHGGEYFYFGLNDVIKKMLSKDITEYINLLINIVFHWQNRHKQLCGLFYAQTP